VEFFFLIIAALIFIPLGVLGAMYVYVKWDIFLETVKKYLDKTPIPKIIKRIRKQI
jgi:hypothetical protein